MISDARIIASLADCMCGQAALPYAIKCQVDLDRYKVVIDRVHPDLIVESGTYRGGSALWFADQAGCPVVTADVASQHDYQMVSAWRGRVTPLLGQSTDPTVVAVVRHQIERLRARRVMVVLDSDHSGPHVYRELTCYAPLVSVGSYLVVEDTIVRWAPWFGIEGSPLDAVERYLAGPHGCEWELDQELEDAFETTQHPDGWLRRVRPYEEDE